LAGVVIVCGAGIVVRQMAIGELGAQQAVCRQNLKDIYGAIASYRNAHDGQYPESLEQLLPGFLRDKRCLVCDSDEIARSGHHNFYSSYLYHRPPDELKQGEDFVVLQEREGIHKAFGPFPRGHMTLTLDRRVRFVEVPEVE